MHGTPNTSAKLTPPRRFCVCLPFRDFCTLQYFPHLFTAPCAAAPVIKRCIRIDSACASLQHYTAGRRFVPLQKVSRSLRSPPHDPQLRASAPLCPKRTAWAAFAAAFRILHAPRRASPIRTVPAVFTKGTLAAPRRASPHPMRTFFPFRICTAYRAH